MVITMKRICKILIITAAVIVALLGLCAIIIIIPSFDSDWKSGIDGNHINLRTPSCIIEMINGRADETFTYKDSGAASYYYENRTLFGINHCNISYHGNIFGVNQIIADIPANENAEDEFEKIVSAMVNSYSGRQGYYKNEDSINNDSIKTVCLGTNLGAVGISVSIELFQDKIIIKENAAY